MPHSKTPGGAGASEKFLKQQAESADPSLSIHPCTLHSFPFANASMNETEHGEGASNAAGHTEGKAPGEAPVRLDTLLGELPSPKSLPFLHSLLACL